MDQAGKERAMGVTKGFIYRILMVLWGMGWCVGGYVGNLWANSSPMDEGAVTLVSTMAPWWQGVIGIMFFVGIPVALNSQRRLISWKKIGALLVSQCAVLVLFLKSPWMKRGFEALASGVQVVQSAVLKGTSFVFGYVGGGPSPFVVDPEKSGHLMVFMFQILPLIMVMGALSMMLFHWGVLPWIVKQVSRVTKKVWSLGGALSTAMVGKLFWGQSDTPLFVKPYLATFTRNELFSLMCAGMATASVSIFALYATLLQPYLGFSTALGHIVTAAVVNIPAALILAELFFPENQELTQGDVGGAAYKPYHFSNTMEAIAQGTLDGWSMITGIAAMMVVALALVYLLNDMCVFTTGALFGHSWTLQTLLGYAFSPLAWLMGIPAGESLTMGGLLAEKTIFNEVVTLMRLGESLGKSLGNGMGNGTVGVGLSSHSLSIGIYGLCNFSNISSIAMQIGAIGALVPSRRGEIAMLAPRALVASVLAGGLSSALVSLVMGL